MLESVKNMSIKHTLRKFWGNWYQKTNLCETSRKTTRFTHCLHLIESFKELVLFPIIFWNLGSFPWYPESMKKKKVRNDFWGGTSARLAKWWKCSQSYGSRRQGRGFLRWNKNTMIRQLLLILVFANVNNLHQKPSLLLLKKTKKKKNFYASHYS